ncbi:MAG TPA: hypothetical protein VHN78_06385 [Chloroflexota bacterium]|nr:hypothetical protein [Chloroflexota bacterium]
MAGPDAELTAAQAAARIGRSKSQVLKLLQKGKLQGRRIGILWVTTAGAVDAYLASNPRPGRPPGRRQK